jgi:hypothetical protein
MLNALMRCTVKGAATFAAIRLATADFSSAFSGCGTRFLGQLVLNRVNQRGRMPDNNSTLSERSPHRPHARQANTTYIL